MFTYILTLSFLWIFQTFSLSLVMLNIFLGRKSRTFYPSQSHFYESHACGKKENRTQTQERALYMLTFESVEDFVEKAVKSIRCDQTTPFVFLDNFFPVDLWGIRICGTT